MIRAVLPLLLLLAAGCSTPAPADDPHAAHRAAATPAYDPHVAHRAATATPADDPHAAHRAAAASSAEPPGYATVEVPTDRQQLIGLKTGTVERATLTGTIRAAAVVEADETREAHVHSRLMGWVRRLDVNAVGQRVEKGQPLYALYSQELYAGQQEYLRARQTAPDLAASARARLRLWGVPEDQIRRIEERGAQEEVVFRSPIAGTVIEKQVLEGHYIEPEMMLYRIADLSRVWIVAEIYEFEVERVDREGTPVVSVQGLSEPVSARLDYVYPTVDPTSRTVRVRLVAENRGGALRPGSFATVELPTRPVEALWIPEAALVDTGVRQVVYVALGDGRFRPTEVRAGQRSEGKVEILEGLEEGEAVVTSAQFLLDSESRIRGGGSAAGHGAH